VHQIIPAAVEVATSPLVLKTAEALVVAAMGSGVAWLGSVQVRRVWRGAVALGRHRREVAEERDRMQAARKSMEAADRRAEIEATVRAVLGSRPTISAISSPLSASRMPATLSSRSPYINELFGTTHDGRSGRQPMLGEIKVGDRLKIVELFGGKRLGHPDRRVSLGVGDTFTVGHVDKWGDPWPFERGQLDFSAGHNSGHTVYIPLSRVVFA
jgi:hypothetical protein